MSVAIARRYRARPTQADVGHYSSTIPYDKVLRTCLSQLWPTTPPHKVKVQNRKVPTVQEHGKVQYSTIILPPSGRHSRARRDAIVYTSFVMIRVLDDDLTFQSTITLI